ncbi:hypothetical protein DFQ05_2201 [Winogradskyella wandonensis]|uniref:DNA primase n=2 Tax=Winogradskyella TaxID=286104 RepID=A0A4R1KPF7_9FLAO|nr:MULTISPECIES: hypothetical protein [Winogradskyella]TCK66915.1 hypothetical protein DFQ05_2201 [Winogradskyella wandonensis]SHG52624.1 hypothetical protein SAMN05444148_0345 [Winogradskyella jejuensis]
MKDTIQLKRVIVDFAKLNEDILDLLVNAYPDGYDDRHIISFVNAQGETVKCVEVRTEDTIYLVKISKKLVIAMEEHDTEDDDYDYDDEDEDFEYEDFDESDILEIAE